jgi:hypothetical protein
MVKNISSHTPAWPVGRGLEINLYNFTTTNIRSLRQRHPFGMGSKLLIYNCPGGTKYR